MENHDPNALTKTYWRASETFESTVESLCPKYWRLQDQRKSAIRWVPHHSRRRVSDTSQLLL